MSRKEPVSLVVLVQTLQTCTLHFCNTCAILFHSLVRHESHFITFNNALFNAVKPEKVMNPYGATAGANSGDFHVYRHARARELERMNGMDEAEEEELKDLEYESMLQGFKTEEEGKTEKRRRKRQREKEAKLRKKSLAKAGIETTVAAQEIDEKEFTYVSHVQKQQAETDATETDKKVPAIETEDGKLEIANDGSFLEMMKRKLEEQAKEGPGAVEKEEPPLKRQTT
jgi:hypothetical protein